MKVVKSSQISRLSVNKTFVHEFIIFQNILNICFIKTFVLMIN